MSQISDAMIACMGDFEKVVRGVKDAGAATAAIDIDKVRGFVGSVKKLSVELFQSEGVATPEQKKQFQDKDLGRITSSVLALQAALARLQKVKGLPPDLVRELGDASKELADVVKEPPPAAAAPPPPSAEFMADSAPDSSGWAVWLLCVLVLATCVGFLCRDGLWSNAIRLVNVVFAGLLAMNFYEPLARFLTNYSESLHPYVSLFDFLALWTCFVFFMVVFRAVTDAVSKVRVRFLKIVDQAGGIVLSLCTGWVMVGFTLASLHAAPLAQYPLLGSFQPQNSMFLGMFAPDREWLGFTRYQSSGPYCRSVGKELSEQCAFPKDYIEKHLERRMHVEKYILGNNDHAILVNPHFMTRP